MDDVKVGVIGLGMGRAHLKGYEASPNAQVVALCDINEELLGRVLKERPNVRGFTDYGEMLAMRELQAVSVALPNYLHAPVTIAALEAGKHVLCEKPMAMNAAEAEQMKAASERTGRILMMHFNMRYMASAATLKPIMEAGGLGDVYHVTTTYTRRDGYPRLGSWFGQKAKSGGGPLIDLGVHRIDLALWLMGYPKPVSAFGNVYDLLARGLTMSIRGTEGAVFEQGGQLVLCKKEHGVPTTCVLEQLKPKQTPQEHFVECIIEGKQPEPSAEHGVIVMKILDAIYESARTGGEVKIR